MARKREPRPPSNPAVTSLPGAASSRTDGGPSQPIRVASGQAYGQRQFQEAQQAAAPLPVGPPTDQPQGPPQPQGPTVADQLFAPTQRPNEPAQAGTQNRPIMQNSPDMALQIMAAVYPHPDILRLLNDVTS